MSAIAVIGAQWGDEGKGKMVDLLAQKMDIVCRFNGGPNAGHTVINEYGKFGLHQVPSGIFNPKITCIIGNGMVVNPQILVEEIDTLKKKGISCQNLRISNKAHLIMIWHILLDELQEKKRGKALIGTTLQGIAPVYADKVYRFGIRAGDLLDEELFKKKFKEAYSRYEELFISVYKCKCLDTMGVLLGRYLRLRKVLLPYIANTEFIIWEALQYNKNILFEGAQATLLDIDFGTYSNVTSSTCIAAGIYSGSGIPFGTKIDEVIGVIKAYPTRVGSKEQPFPTEMPEDIAHPLRERAHEYGTTTGRARRIGYFDALLAKYAAKINGFTSLAITRLDSLAGTEELKICNAYRFKNGKILYCIDFDEEEFSIDELSEVQPLYVPVRGWKTFPEDCKEFSDLPWQVQDYTRRIENLVGVPIKYISVGPGRDQTIVV